VRWDSVKVLDESSVRSEIAGSPDDPRWIERARAEALRLRAARFVRLDASTLGEVRRFHARLYDVSQRDRPIDERTTIVPANAPLDSALMAVADSLLVRPTGSAAYGHRPTGTKSLPALQAFLKGMRAVDEWDLASADTHFLRARTFDAGFARANLWLSLARWWSGRGVAGVRSDMEIAAAGRSGIPLVDLPKLDAMRSLTDPVRDRHPCAFWEKHAREQNDDFTAAFGAAQCLRKDTGVLPDPNSDSGWRFRSGYESAMQHYLHALALRPFIIGGFRRNGFEDVRSWLQLSGRELRSGTAPGVGSFYAYLSIANDTLAFTPIPASVFATDSATAHRMPRIDLAVSRQKNL
jgi:hypothetical protein